MSDTEDRAREACGCKSAPPGLDTLRQALQVELTWCSEAILMGFLILTCGVVGAIFIVQGGASAAFGGIFLAIAILLGVIGVYAQMTKPDPH